MPKMIDNSFYSRCKKIFLIQLAVTVVVAGVAAWFGGFWLALAALYGGACAIVIMVWLAMRIQKMLARQSHQSDDSEASMNIKMLLAGLLPRFLFIIAAFGVGIGVLELQAAPMVIAFALTYIAYIFSFRISQFTEQPGEQATTEQPDEQADATGNEAR